MPLYRERYRCVVCGAVTAGRRPVHPHHHRERGDGTLYFPRRHHGPDGEPCVGNTEYAAIIDVIVE